MRLELPQDHLATAAWLGIAGGLLVGTMAMPFLAPLTGPAFVGCLLGAAARSKRKLIIDDAGITEVRLLGESHVAWERIDNYSYRSTRALVVESKYPRATIHIDSRYAECQLAVERVLVRCGELGNVIATGSLGPPLPAARVVSRG